MSQEATAESKIGYLWLQPGVSRRNGYTLLFAGLTAIPFMAFINIIQPIILEVALGIPRESQGALTANLAVAQELIILALVSPIGALSDRIGRPRIVSCGYLLLAAGFFAYPWATEVWQLTAIRCVYAVGVACVVGSYSPLLADYPAEKSRGKFIALMGVLNGLGILILAVVGSNLPRWLEAAGYSSLDATRIAMALIAIICVASAVIMLTGLRGKTGHEEHSSTPLLQLLREGLGAARNPRIAVAYASAFAARGDVVVVGTYVALWVSQAGIESGMSPAEAQGRAGQVIGVVQGAALLVAPLLGILNDRVDRVTALVMGMLMACAGYMVFGLQPESLGQFVFIAAIALGIGQMSSIIAGQTLISQEAEPRIAGSVVGMFSFFGAIGTLVGSWVGGQLFDLWRPGAPFLLMGIFNGLVFVAALIVMGMNTKARDA